MSEHITLPHEMLAANWDPEIIQAYLVNVQQDREDGKEEEDEAMSTDEEESEPSVSIHKAVDIASDDDAFSSDDEFTDEEIRDKQHVQRELVLGRPAPELLTYVHKQLVDMRDYLKQLDDVDIELEESTGSKCEVITRRNDQDEVTEDGDLDGDVEVVLKELRMRSRKKVCDSDRTQLMKEVVLLAQGLFRKERLIKSLEDEDD
jgi:hypothetical protein